MDRNIMALEHKDVVRAHILIHYDYLAIPYKHILHLSHCGKGTKMIDDLSHPGSVLLYGVALEVLLRSQ